MTLRTVRLRTAYRGPDDAHPAVANLDPVLLDAVRAAAVDAAARHGSEAEAAHWVAAAETLTYLNGEAVDVAPGPGVGSANEPSVTAVPPALDTLKGSGWTAGPN